MYNTPLKVGKFLCVHGVCPGVGTSTIAAMTASLFAAQGQKTLLLSTDADPPYDGASILSSDIIDNHLDELIALENSNGLTQEKLGDYVSYLSNNLGYLRASSRLSRLTKDAAKTINHIVEIACYDFQYVILDVGFSHTTYYTGILKNADLVIHVLGQNPKSIVKAKDLYAHGGFGEDVFMVPVVADYIDSLPLTLKAMEKQLKVDEVFAIHHDNDVYKSVYTRDIAGFVFKNKKKGGFLGFSKKKKDESDTTAIDELEEICNLIEKALASEEGVGVNGGNR